ncbi:MAG: GNAT family N-acetyltransferase [Magnetospirillum sp.]|nr:GNAT family N-acetyltransferase [Magnetospirillum sp.]
MDIREWRPGDLGRLVELHGRYYSAHWDLSPTFEAEVAEELGVFCRTLRPGRDGLWVAAETDGIAMGGVAIQGMEDGEARLRWFIVDPACHGRGVGDRLLATALDFCRRAGFRRVVLHTFKGLEAAHALYRRHGFVLAAEEPGSPWGPPLMLQTFVLEVSHD